jgi:hypothetical protein
MKISHNSQCPCGSGNKYKHCCGVDMQPCDDSCQNALSDQLSQAINDSDVSSLEEVNIIAEKLQANHNEHPIKEFLGLTPTQMTKMLYHPWDSPDLLTFNQNWFPKKSIAFDLFDALVVGIGDKGIKATAQGNLPIKLCNDIYAIMPDDHFHPRSSIRSEVEFDELHTMRLVGEKAGVIKLSKKHFSLTIKGRKLIRSEERAHLFHTLIKTYVTNFNWGYRDGYQELEIIQNSWLFSLYCLSIFGVKLRSSGFYSGYFIRAFPLVLNEVNGDLHSSNEDYCSRCYEVRTLERFAQFWGLIKRSESKSVGSSRFKTDYNYELRPQELSQWLIFHA